ncbi:hypothetical protein FRB90_003253 [Tulasnella sp. 427]|nr:hypothetical protein FRB90_003253 [Tulasnella sp. 427]
MATSLEAKLIAAVAVLAYVVYKRWLSQQGSDVGRLKKPAKSHWLWGHEYDAWAIPDGQFYVKNINELGQAFTMKGGLFLALTDPAAITHMFSKRPYEYTKSQIIRPLIERLLGKSLPWAEGEQHRRQRQMLAPVFTNENVKRMDEEIHRAADKVVEVLREHVHAEQKAGEKDKGVEVNVLDWCSRATLDIIGSVGFGHDFQCGTSEEAKAIARSWKELISVGLQFPGFVAPLVIRAFPFITDLPVEAIQAQGEIKTIINSIRVKKGQLINVPTIAINRNAAVWGPDAEVFRPERFLEVGGMPAPSTLTQGWSGIFSFLEGPRICIGFRLALFEYKVIMTTLLKNFEFVDTGAKIATQFSSTLQPFVEGRKEDGVQIPLFVKDLHQ